ncbi:MAG: hypothetical protein JKP98_20575 [Rhodobacteraceae bacterium]|nr:hypothetical protein [Paracoccaceae bacterium]MBL4558595.1 hypothetical protein [Paracoccaceae bacterium]
MDQAAGWIILRVVYGFLVLLDMIALLFCDLPRLVKYGPRYWRVQRRIRRRASQRSLA